MGHYDSFYEDGATEEFNRSKQTANERLKNVEDLSENFNNINLLVIKDKWAHINTNPNRFYPEQLHDIVGMLIAALDSANRKIEQLEKLKNK